MGRSRIVALAIASAFVAAFLYGIHPVLRSSPGISLLGSCLDGDSNGDGAVDVADPIHLLLYLFRNGQPPASCASSPQPVTIAIIVRHAEKEGTGTDPGLTAEGQARAQHLADMLSRAAITHLIADSLRRTMETIRPLADLKSLPIEKIEEPAAVVERLKELPPGSIGVVAHHSYTIPSILEKLSVDGASTIEIGGTHYDNFLVVLVPKEGKAQLLHLKY